MPIKPFKIELEKHPRTRVELTRMGGLVKHKNKKGQIPRKTKNTKPAGIDD